MGLDDFDLDVESGETNVQGAESSKEVLEKFKESVKKASAGIKRTQKDERKAKQYDMLLASFLVKIIIDKKYDFILELLFRLLNKGYSSNFLLGIISLINIEIAHKIRELSSKPYIEFSYKSPKEIQFDDSELHIQVRNRINFWVEDIVDSVSVEYSHIMTTRLMKLLSSDSEEGIILFISIIFRFFLHEINIIISESKSISISSFILGEVKKTLKKLNIEEV